MKLVECVPNISEGRDPGVIEAVASEVETVPGANLLDVDPGAATNRTVITFVGDQEAVLEASFRLIRKASELIDMRRHKGEHPRNGATDVCPFVPLGQTTMEECVVLARRLGERVGRELGIPVYLYENAAARPERRNLTDIRQGGYEALLDKLGKAEWKPDFGPNEFNESIARTGATQIGARNFLIAYNINLNTKNVSLARRIGLMIREKGGAVVRDVNGDKVAGPDGKPLRHEKGLFEHCKATGWFIDEYDLAQVTMNLTDFGVTPPHAVFDKVCEIAWGMGLRVTGSEIVGLVPLDAMLQAGRHYQLKQGESDGVPESDLIEAAVSGMGLSQISPFDPMQRIVEYRIAKKRPLASHTLSQFVDELSRRSPAPGGGSVAALCGALSAGLSSMVANLTVGKKGYDGVLDDMRSASRDAQRLKDRFLIAVDDDTFAFNKVMACLGMPKESAEQKALRDAAILDANKEATLVPLSVMESIPETLEVAKRVVANGNRGSLSDAGVAVLAARACAVGAYYNVLTNLAAIDDDEFCSGIKAKADLLEERIRKRCHDLDAVILEKLKKAAD